MEDKIVLMNCCGNRYATIAETVDHNCPTEFAKLMRSAAPIELSRANALSAERFPVDVNTAVQFYAYGYCDGGLNALTTRIIRALYDILENMASRPTLGLVSWPSQNRSADTMSMTHANVITAAGEFVKMHDALIR